MNMEAMGVLGDSDSISQQNNQSMMHANNISMMNMSQMAMTEKNFGQSNYQMSS